MHLFLPTREPQAACVHTIKQSLAAVKGRDVENHGHLHVIFNHDLTLELANIFDGSDFYSNVPLSRTERASAADMFQLCVQQDGHAKVSVSGVTLYRMPSSSVPHNPLGCYPHNPRHSGTSSTYTYG